MPRTHGTELRQRLLLCAALWLVFAALIFWQKEGVLAFMLAPLQNILGAGAHAQTTAVGELFFTYLRIAGWGGLIAVVPFVVWNIGAFLAPGLYKHEKRWLYPTLIAFPTLFYAGAAFAFFVLVPLMLGYLLSFTQPEVLIQPRLADYLSFIFTTALAVGGAFLLPLVLVVAMALGFIKPQALSAARRWVVVAVFIIAAIVTPPDPFSQTALAVPLLLLYELAIVVGRRVAPK
jgi:sec-independent protein translocase protein TatC